MQEWTRIWSLLLRIKDLTPSASTPAWVKWYVPLILGAWMAFLFFLDMVCTSMHYYMTRSFDLSTPKTLEKGLIGPSL